MSRCDVQRGGEGVIAKATKAIKRRFVRFYGIKNHNPYPCYEMADYVTDHPSNDDRRVAWDTIGDIEVSTVFLCTDHSLTGSPILFETMVFGGKCDQNYWRYHTWDDAECGHKQICDAIKKGKDLINAGIEAAVE